MGQNSPIRAYPAQLPSSSSISISISGRTNFEGETYITLQMQGIAGGCLYLFHLFPFLPIYLLKSHRRWSGPWGQRSGHCKINFTSPRHGPFINRSVLEIWRSSYLFGLNWGSVNPWNKGFTRAVITHNLNASLNWCFLINFTGLLDTNTML